MLHVLLDFPLYNDIQPFYPLTINLFYNIVSPSFNIELCILTGVFGAFCYMVRIFVSVKRKQNKFKLVQFIHYILCVLVTLTDKIQHPNSLFVEILWSANNGPHYLWMIINKRF